ncbi:MAG: asparagine synthase-related protein [Candidatus Korarchaeota archaeon]
MSSVVIKYEGEYLIGSPFLWDESIQKIQEYNGKIPDVTRCCGAWSYVDTIKGVFIRDAIGLIPIYIHNKEAARVPYAFNHSSIVYRVPPGSVVRVSDGVSITYYRRVALEQAWKITNVGTIKDMDEAVRELKNALLGASSRIKKNGMLLLSGGVDSAVTAVALREKIKRGITLSSGQDIEFARFLSRHLGLDLEEVTVTPENVECELHQFISKVPVRNVLDLEIGIGFWMIARELKGNVIFSGQGADELFGGYAKFCQIEKSRDVNEICMQLILDLHESNIEREDAIFATHNLDHNMLFFDPEVLAVSMKIDGKLKVSNGKRKIVLREVARKIGVPDTIAFREKKALQYGAGIKKILEKIASKNNTRLPFLLTKIREELNAQGLTPCPIPQNLPHSFSGLNP